MSWKAEEVAIQVKCNIHPWMHGYFVVVKGPYAITDDKGSYTIEDVPPGQLHRDCLAGRLRDADPKVTVAAGKPGTADFTFKAK